MTSPYVPIWAEDRKRLDSRRVGAFLVDLCVVAPVLVPLAVIFGSITPGAWLLYTACVLTYYHVLETRTGQTVGKRLFDLRVVRASDAGPASAKAISARTILRLIEGPAIGMIAMIATGKRRRRLGDLAAGTVVTRASARPYTPARRSPLVTIYPSLWIGAAAAVVLWLGHNGEPYLANVDSLCKQMNDAQSALGPNPPIDRAGALRIALGQAILQLHPYNQRMVRARDEILDALNTEVRYVAFMTQHYRQTHSQADFQAQLETLLSMGRRHSEQLSRHFGLKYC